METKKQDKPQTTIPESAIGDEIEEYCWARAIELAAHLGSTERGFQHECYTAIRNGFDFGADWQKREAAKVG